jgi:hypothetical protein
MTTCFIGVVSYAGSRFADSQGPRGLGHRLAAALGSRGIPTTVRVNTADLFEDSSIDIDEALVQASLDAEHALMDEWDRYLRDGRRGLRSAASRSLRRARRLHRRAFPPGPGMVRRLLNIEASHLDLLRRGLALGADWIIILEDDAETADLEDCAAGLAGLLTPHDDRPAYVNISRSFSPEELGISHLLEGEPTGVWSGSVPRSVLGASKPISNTVCAIAYRADFVRQLLEHWDRLPLTPVVPIDWKLNDVLMTMHAEGTLGASACWIVEPAPIDQRSMQ